jgi:hypothetical protein
MTDTTTAAPKAEGKCAKLHAMWQQAGDGKLLPRAFAIELAVAEGANPSTARTQYQRYLQRFQQTESTEAAPE